MIDIQIGQNKNTFEIGLVLAGAVSAGAYSAGVVDFLIEALDGWYATKESEVLRSVPLEQRQVPPHNVHLRAIAGSSAGSMVGALAAITLNETPCAINPAHLPEKADETNKLYSSWVVKADIASMLTTDDLKKGQKLTSLLDSSFLERLAEKTMVTRPPCQPRAYVADPLALFICVTNLRGVPYTIDFKGDSQDDSHGPNVIEHWMSNHSDYVQFNIVKPGSRPNVASAPAGIFLYPEPQNEEERIAWQKLAWAAVASGAFPLALAPRIVTQGAAAYDEREWPIPSSGYKKIPPDWDGKAPDDYFFLTVDGGVMNNEPLEYARQEIAGIGRHNERDGEKATKAIVMIDPFPDAIPFRADYTPEEGLFNVAGELFKSLMSQAKFKIDELKLARDPNVFSRFMITPTRHLTGRESDKEKWPALASNSLAHFGGFLHEEFRRHDFLLGRRNCQRFLQKYFILPVENQLFDQWPKELKQPGSPYLVTVKGAYYLPIIPLVGDLNSETREPQPPWPEMPETELEKLKKGMSVRTKLVLNQAACGLFGSGGKSVLSKAGLFVIKFLVRPVLGWLAGWLAGKMIKKIKENLVAAELLKIGH